MRYSGGIWDVPGLWAGHAQDPVACTGCTVVLSPEGAVAAVDVRGAAPGTRETDVLRPGNVVEKVHAVLLTGGSAFGLAAADGVMSYLEEKGIGFPTQYATVPIVVGAVLYDLGVGNARVRPDAAMGRAACKAAVQAPIAQGKHGAGMGATVGKILGHGQDGGIGSASIVLPGGVVVAALIAVNALGDVVEEDGRILRGAMGPDGFLDTQRFLTGGAQSPYTDGFRAAPGTNTTIGIIATNAAMDRGGAYRLAVAGHDGLARSIRPVHTQADGDALFALSTGAKRTDISPVVLAAAAAEAARRAVVNAVLDAEDEA